MTEKVIHFVVGNITITGGVERVTQILSREFTKRCAKVIIHSIYSASTESSNSDGINIISYGLISPDHEKNIFFKIERSLLNGLILRKSIRKTSSNDYFIFQGFYLAAYLPFIRTSYQQKIVCEHNTFNAPSRSSQIARKLIYRLFSPLLIVLTEADLRHFVGIGIKRVRKIPNPSPYNLSNTSPTTENKTIISLGRFTHQKRFDLMIEIISPLLKEHPSWDLKIQGYGEDIDIIKAAASKSGASERIHILPAGDPIKLYQKGAIFLMTSLFEGLPMTLIESMSFGIPAICYNCSPGLSEIINDSVNGYLVPMNDSTTFIDKLNQLMDNPALRKQLGANAKLTARNFSVPKIISDWEKIIK